jgi:hypothetical protein
MVVFAFVPPICMFQIDVCFPLAGAAASTLWRCCGGRALVFLA